MTKAPSTNGSAVEVRERVPDAPVLSDVALVSDWNAIGEAQHVAQFYETDEFLLDSLSYFIAAGLVAGEACIVVATQEHRERLEQLLLASGLDLPVASATGQYVALDAAGTLAKFTVAGQIDPEGFVEVIGEIITRAAAGQRRVRVFGEMVMLLWMEGKTADALWLEELWNKLQVAYPFLLFCGYPIHGSDGAANGNQFDAVCAKHSHVIPAESYAGLTSHDDRLRAIVQLQQKASTLEAEINRRNQAEETIRMLLGISERLNSTLDLDTLLDLLVVEACRLIRAESGVAGLYTLHGMVVHKYYQRGEWLPLDYCWPPMHGLPGWLIIHKVPYLTNNALADTQIVHELCLQFGVLQALSTPILSARGEILGFFEIHNKKDGSLLTQDDKEQLVSVSQVAAIAIQNAMAYRQLQQADEERALLLAREQEARLRAEEASRLKDEFLATVSHELRTPLTVIMAWAQRLRRGKHDQASVSRGLEIIERNAGAQSQLVEDILDVSRIITGKLRLTIVPVDLAAVINAAIDSVQLAADAKGVQLVVMLEPSVGHISGDAGRLQQVIWNLLSNAIKFTSAGGRVEVRLERCGSHVQISVRDTGEGISGEFLPFMFDRFRQADGTSTRRHGGLGLGLSIVRHLVELHGGTVQGESPGEGCGAVFTIRLPLAATPSEIRHDQ